jgi:hypothetical protein
LRKLQKVFYILRRFLNQTDINDNDESEPEIVNDKIVKKDSHKIINAYGIYWNRNLVHWKTQPDLLGIQQIGASEVNFKEQIGIYLLHDSRETVYVGQYLQLEAPEIKKKLKQQIIKELTDKL